MNKNTKKKLFKGTALTLALTAAISAGSNMKKEGRYNQAYNNAIVSETNIDGLGSYVLQGGCSDGTYNYLTAYDNSKKGNSIILLLDKDNNFIKAIDTRSRNHIGGITYDYDHNLIWVSDSHGSITALNRDDLLNDIIKPIYYRVDMAGDDLKGDTGNPSVACLTYAQGNIYAASFTTWRDAKLKKVPVNDEGCPNLDESKTVKFVHYAQGLEFCVKDDNIYLIVSTSHHVCYDSILKFYKYDENIEDYSKEWYKFFRMPPMAEGIYLDSDNNINIVNESNARKYNIFADYFYSDTADITELDSKKLTNTYKYW